MRVLVLGGTVFIGRALVIELLREGHDVGVVHRGTHEPDELRGCTHIHSDLRKEGVASVAAEIACFQPDVVCDNIAATRAHAEGVVAALGPQRYVVTSSMDVYRAYGALHAGTSTEPVPVDETSPVREERYPYRGQIEGMDDYEKLDVEETYLEQGATVVRLPMVYGPHDRQRREEFVLRRVRAGRERIPVGSGSWLGTKGFAEDVARGMRLVVERDDVRGEVFNLGETRTHPMGVWAQMILDAAGSGAELARVPDDALPPDLQITGAVGQHFLVDSAKARRVLGFSDTDPVRALEASVGWHLANPPTTSDDDFSADDAALAASSATG